MSHCYNKSVLGVDSNSQIFRVHSAGNKRKAMTASSLPVQTSEGTWEAGFTQVLGRILNTAHGMRGLVACSLSSTGLEQRASTLPFNISTPQLTQGFSFQFLYDR